MTSKQALIIFATFMCLICHTFFRVIHHHNNAGRNHVGKRLMGIPLNFSVFASGIKDSSMDSFGLLSLHNSIPALPTTALPEIDNSPLTQRHPRGTQTKSFDASLQKSVVYPQHSLPKRVSVSICALVKSKKNWKTLDDSRIMHNVIASTCKTTSMEWIDFEVSIFLGADYDDAFWLRHHSTVKHRAWTFCGLNVTFHFYQKHGNFLPFNQLMRDAYRTGSEYLVRINDDTEFTSKAWISLGVNALKTFHPPNVGVVGPSCSQGNTKILTHDMVHRTHLEIFESYYPVVFHNWYIDDWISHVYGASRTQKIKDWTVVHHVDQQGQRYAEKRSDSKLLHGEIAAGEKLIKAYLAAKDSKFSKSVFKNFTNSDLFKVVYLQSAELKSEIFKSQILFELLIE